MKKKENLFLTELALNAFLPFDDGEKLLEKRLISGKILFSSRFSIMIGSFTVFI